MSEIDVHVHVHAHVRTSLSYVSPIFCKILQGIFNALSSLPMQWRRGRHGRRWTSERHILFLKENGKSSSPDLQYWTGPSLKFLLPDWWNRHLEYNAIDEYAQWVRLGPWTSPQHRVYRKARRNTVFRNRSLPAGFTFGTVGAPRIIRCSRLLCSRWHQAPRPV